MPIDSALPGKCWTIAAALLVALCLTNGPGLSQSAPAAGEFAAQAAMADLFEIESGKLVEEKASPNAANLAVPLAKDHSAMLAELKSLVQAGKVKAELPAALDTSLQGKFDKLKALKGGAFDKSYLDTQVDVQKNHVSLFESYAKNGDNSDLKSFAAKHLPRLQQHFKAVRDMRELMMQE